MKPIVCALLLCLFGGVVHAGDDGPQRNLVSLAVSASEEVASDLLVVRMMVLHEAAKQATTADRVNDDMAWALATARAVAGIKAQTLDYRTTPVYEDRQIRAWRTQQSLRLESADTTALTALLGTLQERLAIESIGYEISPALREAIEQRLIDSAIAAFRGRASQVARAFGRADYGIVNVNVGTSGYRPPPPVAYAGRALAMKAEVADPSIAGGEQTVTVDVNGTIELGGD
ncbi:MAG: SIMPL domain-containing protein [Gammaproteobacteria bacterium]|nr:SIMPL domain-containing protein [Gammaproteobacteria bacterium]